MTKKDLVEEVVYKTGLNKTLVKETVDSFLEILFTAMSDGKRIELRGFGVFETRRMKPKKARNPRTGETLIIPERDKVLFKISKVSKK
ncbi:integration host factor subunit beta [bacterium]|nr:integration host factor subunit beta [bacterium]